MKFLTFIFCCYMVLAAHAQVLCKWNADSSAAVSAEFQCYRGETLQFQPTLKQYGTVISNATYTLQYQTNGMGSAWWTNSVLQFTPAMDVGASTYTVFIRAETTNGISYRANAKIKMLGSPGATPNVLPIPPQSIDFSVVTVSNAPWLLTEADTNALAALSAHAYNTSNPHAVTAAQVGALSPSATNGWTVSAHQAWITADQVPAYDNTRLASVDSNYFVRVSGTNLSLYSSSPDTFCLTYEPDTVYDPMLRLIPFPTPFYFAKTGDVTVITLDGWTIYAGADTSSTYMTSLDEGFWGDLLEPTGYPITLYNSIGVPATYGSPVLNYIPSSGTNAIKTFASINDIQKSVSEIPHATITDRDANDAHPISAITGLQDAIAGAGGVPSVWTNMVWGASGTNATYRMSWDVTNGTFRVLEILP